MTLSMLPLVFAALASAAADTGSARRAVVSADEVLAKTRAAYAALTSYADSGTVLEEAAGFTDRSSFRTFFQRSPRNMLIDFRGVAAEYKSGLRIPDEKRVVIWFDNSDLQKWSRKEQAHDTYPAEGGQQVNALKGAGYATVNISILVPSQFFSQSGLVGPVQAMEDAEADGFETVNGRKCHRIMGVERWRYPSGQVTGVRPITLWIDAETYLIHKIVQDTPKGMPRGTISRRTTTLKHRANPKLAPAQFQFTVPES